MIENSVHLYLVHVLDVLKSAALPTYMVVANCEHGKNSDDVRLTNLPLHQGYYIKWLSHTVAKVLRCCRFPDYTNGRKAKLKFSNLQRGI